MERIVRALFPDTEISTNVRAMLRVRGDHRASLEIDVYLPKLKLGFEYQDPHHYFHAHFGSSTLQEYQERDQRKKKIADYRGITIINVPFWWNWDAKSLVASIKGKRPDLLVHVDTRDVAPLSDSPPQHIVDKWSYEIPGLGAPMFALHMPQKSSFDPTNWWIFEKYDGMRGVWSPQTRAMYSRWGTHLQIPQYISDVLPNMCWLDGEIWFGRERNTRHKATKISNSPALHFVEWKNFKFVVFDSPFPHGKLPYKERYAFLLSIFPKDLGFTFLAPHQLCTGKEFLASVFYQIRAKGGEGIILRDPEAPYVSGYSRFLFKHRGFSDAEAQVLSQKSENIFICRVANAHLTFNTAQNADKEEEKDEKGEGKEGKGEAKGREGEEREMEGNERDERERDEKERKEGERKGKEHYNLKKDRKDTERQEMEGTEREEIEQERKRREEIEREIEKELKRSEEREKEGKEIEERKEREFYDVEMQLDEEMFTGKKSEIIPGKFVSFRYTGRIHNGPPINPRIYCTREEITDWRQILHNKQITYQQIWKPQVLLNDWKSIANRRKFFDAFAFSRGFDPKEPENWYDVAHELRNVEGCLGILEHYNNSVINALMDVYNEIGLERHLFKFIPRHYWADKSNRKKFFDDFAAENKFDASVKNNWYMMVGKLQESKGFAGIRHYGTLSELLMDSYPNIGFSKEEFKTFPSKFWKDVTNQAKLFKEYAEEHRFNPLVAKNWPYHESSILSDKRFHELARFENPIKALFAAFPNIGLKSHLFKSLSAHYWEDKENQKQFFINFAANKNFNPHIAENWYARRGTLQNTKGYTYVRNQHGTIENALISLFPDIGLNLDRFPPSRQANKTAAKMPE
eukprot:Phypoly_transcript_02182.p1 GENE.Phypoly_transcript_02182~~Phypoly_transcript_02182.p1  ORF type:complete len:962 (+),score=179.47 Phypoly_transcript_02182:307-2886(+)